MNNSIYAFMDTLSCVVLICLVIRVLVIWHASIPLVARLLLASGGWFAYANILDIWNHAYLPTYNQLGMHLTFAGISCVLLWKWRRLESGPTIIATNQQTELKEPAPVN